MSNTGNGWVVIAGLGPGNEALVTQEVRDAIADATDIVGYIPYVKRIEPREGLTLHATDNRVEVDRATHALEMAAEGRKRRATRSAMRRPPDGLPQDRFVSFSKCRCVQLERRFFGVAPEWRRMSGWTTVTAERVCESVQGCQ